MPIPSSGSITFTALQSEFGGINSISLSEYVIGGYNIFDITTNSNSNVNEGNRGYFAGGYDSVNINFQGSAISGIQYLTETPISISSTLSDPRSFLTGVNSYTKGYFAGGVAAFNVSYRSTIDAIRFSDEVLQSVSSALQLARSDLAGVQSPVKGYFAGGLNAASPVTEIDGILFSDESAINPSAALTYPGAKADFAGASSRLQGLFGGGRTSPSSTVLTTVEAFNYGTESIGAAIQNLALARRSLGAVYSSEQAYFCGGILSGGSATNEIDSVQFTTLSAGNPVATLATSRAVGSMTLSSFRRGYIGGTTSGVEGFQFSSQTSTGVLSSIYIGRIYAGAVSNPFKNIVVSSTEQISEYKRGYFAGGRDAGAANLYDIEGIQYSNESNINPSTSLSYARHQAAGVSSSTRGYVAGGVWPNEGAVTSNTIEYVQFSNDSTAVTSAILTFPRYIAAPVFSPYRGYFCGGVNADSGSSTNDIEGIQFSNETAINPTAGLVANKYNAAGVSSPVKGYIAGGVNNVVGVNNVIEIFFFGSESISTASAVLPLSRLHLGGAMSSTSGYFAGGWTGSTRTTQIDGIRFLSESAFTPSATLATARENPAGVNSTTHGYWGGGFGATGQFTTGALEEIDAINFSSETARNPSTRLITVRWGAASFTDTNYETPQFSVEPSTVDFSNYRAYFGGGYDPSISGGRNSISGFQFANELTFDLSATLATARWGMGQASSFTRGYFCGGGTGGTGSEVDGILFSDQTAINPSSTLVTPRSFVASASALSKGYFAGGIAPSVTNVVDGIQFSNESTFSTSATLSLSRSKVSGVYSSSAAYFGGGEFSGSVASEIDGLIFVNETSTNTSTTLSAARRGASGLSSFSTGYWGGGNLVNGTVINYIDGIRFSTESSVAPSASLFDARAGAAGTSSFSRGYWTGGEDTNLTVAYNYIDGIRFGDEAAINPSLALSVGRTYHGAVANRIYNLNRPFKARNKGYIAGGGTLATLTSNSIDSIDFSNETINSTNVVLLDGGRSALMGINSTLKGYFAGGFNSSVDTTVIDGIDFSNESSIDVSATLSALSRRGGSGLSCHDFGLFVGGSTVGSAYYDIVNGFRFSDEAYFNPSKTLSSALAYGAGTNSKVNGYITGGRSSSSTYRSTTTRVNFFDLSGGTLSTSITTAAHSVFGVSGPVGSFISGGINEGTYYNQMNELIYASESIHTSSNTLTVARAGGASNQSSTAGYMSGGTGGNPGFRLRSIEGINFSTSGSSYLLTNSLPLLRGFIETNTYSSPVGVSPLYTINQPLSISKFRQFAESQKGFFGGGRNSSGTYLDNIIRLAFDNYSFATISAVLSDAARSRAAGLNSPSRGYFGGGISSLGWYKAIDGIIFSTEAATAVSAELGLFLNDLAGINSSTMGVFGGGMNNLSQRVNALHRLTFSTETNAGGGFTLPDGSRSGLAGVSSALTAKGYFGGGGTDTAILTTRHIDGYDFVNNTTINPSAQLNQVGPNSSYSRTYLVGVNSPSQGYFIGGYYTAVTQVGKSFSYSNYAVNEIDGLDFATETAINPSSGMFTSSVSLFDSSSSLVSYGQSAVNSRTDGYVLDGSTMQSFNFSTWAVSSLIGTGISAKYSSAGVNSGSL